MNEKLAQITKCPIVETIVDIDCAMPEGFEVENFTEALLPLVKEKYPIARKRWLEEHGIQISEDGSGEISANKSVEALQFFHKDEKQLIQFRKEGFSFNRLAPYTSLSDYLEDIRWGFSIFCDLGHPIEIVGLRLRSINVLNLPLENGEVDPAKYVNFQLEPLGGNFKVYDFSYQCKLQDAETKNHATVTLIPQKEATGEILPLVFDISTFAVDTLTTFEWDPIEIQLLSLRTLRNNIFAKGVTTQCLSLLQ